MKVMSPISMGPGRWASVITMTGTKGPPEYKSESDLHLGKGTCVTSLVDNKIRCRLSSLYHESDLFDFLRESSNCVVDHMCTNSI